MAEQRCQAVMAVIGDDLSISQVAEKVGVSRQTLHSWLARYEAEGLSSRPTNARWLLLGQSTLALLYTPEGIPD